MTMVTADFGIRRENDEFFVFAEAEGMFWKSEPFDTESEARAALDDLEKMIFELSPQAKRHPVTGVQ